jgi:hypothetical protein
VPVDENGLAVGDENKIDWEVEEREERIALRLRRHAVGEPQVGKSRQAPPAAVDDVCGHERGVGQP